jgi:soluble lytic murein transglycosylase-like protein
MTSTVIAAYVRVSDRKPVPGRRSRHAVILSGLIAALAAFLFSACSPRAGADAPVLARPTPDHASDLRDGMAAKQGPPLQNAISTDVEALSKLVAGKYRVSRNATRELVHTAYREGMRTGVDPLLILAVVGVESRFNPLAESVAGAVGLMQVIPRFHADKYDARGGQSVLDPQTNISVGAKVLKEYIARDGSQVAGLQRYNGATGDPSNAYANRVLGERQWLQRALRRPRSDVGA